MIKPCRKCGVEAEHYDSIPTCCKECWKARVIANRNGKADYYRAYDRKRGKEPDRKAMYIAKTKRKRGIDPNYMKAYNAVARAVKSGKLIRPDHCHKCLVQCAAQGHHDDHSRPLEVIWLCPVCHAQRHVELAKLRTAP